MVQFDMKLMKQLMNYSTVYEISFQMWPKQYTIYVAKYGVDLYSYGGADDPNETMRGVLEYLDRINTKNHDN